MLYLTTRERANSYTAYRVLRTFQAPDGGMFMPMQLPVFDDVTLDRFERMNFGETVAEILNLFFGTQLSGWNVDFATGRQAVDLHQMGHKLSIIESWHNPAGSHEYFIQRLFRLVTGRSNNLSEYNLWFETVVDIALLFVAYGKLCRRDLYEFDVALWTGDLQMLLAVRYAQKMGLPIRKIILGCADGDGMWDLLSYGDYTVSVKERNVCFEALLWLEFGYDEVAQYLRTLQRKSIYRLSQEKLASFRNQLFGAVVGEGRAKNVAENIALTMDYRMSTDTSKAFAALQDYRAKTGVNKDTLLLSRNMPDN